LAGFLMFFAQVARILRHPKPAGIGLTVLGLDARCPVV
jgi:hypothetical protein